MPKEQKGLTLAGHTPRHTHAAPTSPRHDDRVAIAPGLFAQVVNVTPEIASRWLRKNHADNRAIADKVVDAMCADQQAGRWRLTHQAIAFNATGDLIDGQHRLSAIVRSGVTVPMLVIWNDASALRDPIDRMRPRSLAFITSNRTNVIAAFNILRSFEAGYPIARGFTVADVEEQASKFGDDAKFILDNTQGTYNIIGALLAASVWALPLDRDAVLDFVHKVQSGEMIRAGEPAFAFRNWRSRNLRSDGWLYGLAALNCLRYHIQHAELASVYTGESGYRGITTQRRAKNIPHTPSNDLVPTFSSKLGEEK